MNSVFQPIRTLGWFVYHAVIGVGVSQIFFLVPFLLLIGIAITSFLRTDRETKRRLIIVGVLPVIWIFLGLWGGNYWIDWTQYPVPRNPDWVSYPISVGPWLA